MSAGSIVAEILIGAARGAMDLRGDLAEAERAELDAAIDQVRGILDGIPVRTGPGGTWTEDTERRLEGGEPAALPPKPARIAYVRRLIDGAAAEGVLSRATVSEMHRALDADLAQHEAEASDGPQPPPQPYPEPGETR